MAAVLAALLAGCFISGNSVREVEGDSRFGSYSLKWLDRPGTPAADDLRPRLHARIEQLATELLAQADSPLAQFNRLPLGECLAVPDSVRQLVQHLQALHAFSLEQVETGHAPMVRWWLLTEDGTPLSSTQQQAAVTLEGDQLCREMALQLDLSSLANSYAVDVLDDWLLQNGIENYMLDMAGDVRVKGYQADGRPWRIAVEAPHDHARLAYQLLDLDGHAAVRAGEYQDYVARSRNQSVWPQALTAEQTHQPLRCVTVFAESAVEADTLAHLLMFMGAEQGWRFARERDISAFFVERYAEQGFVSRGTPAFNALKNSEE
ncbi:FAD:protein FMN transferase [Halopseudomonas salegens]|uniref:FAD:protein FMN transferase n=1 Tax=Halopseudomonas salegens TaxID=1434072 RepID=A0A1H2EYI4_9GAMM|nr:FAD:protein FMN transferase [Halopseudomonas salegens]SDT99798.1 thiamine biosynthesis lipoprotein [Halopseudomonas salegens]